MISRIFILFITSILLSACCSSDKIKKENKQTEPDFIKMAERKFDKDYKLVFNSDSTYLIARSSVFKEPDKITNTLKFFIYDNQNNKIIFEDNLVNATIKWLNDHQVQINQTPGIVKGKEDEDRMYGYVYDVVEQKKINSPETKIKKR